MKKRYSMLKPDLNLIGIKAGRDKFCKVLKEHGYIIKRRNYKKKTTNSEHSYEKYPNKIKDIHVTGPDQVWSSDITYLRISKTCELYLSMVLDHYSRKVVGYSISDNLKTESPLEALRMAIENRVGTGKLYHHSDRGTQYCSKEYIEELKKNSIGISMTEHGDPYENAKSERVNRTIKE